MSKLTPITSRTKMNGGIIKGKSGCGCGGDVLWQLSGKADR
jgi:hypothetical protein